MTRLLFVLLCSVALLILLAPGAVAADATNETDSLQIDEHATVEDWSHDGTTYEITLNASRPVTVSLLESLESDEETSANVEPHLVDLPGGEPQTVTIDSENDLAVVTEHFFETGGQLQLSPSSGALIGGPWDHMDAVHSAIGAALAVSTGVVWKVLRRKQGADTEPEKIA